jgi:hypothetical protein
MVKLLNTTPTAALPTVLTNRVDDDGQPERDPALLGAHRGDDG